MLLIDGMSPLRGLAEGFETSESINNLVRARHKKEREQWLEDYQVMEGLKVNDRYANAMKPKPALDAKGKPVIGVDGKPQMTPGLSPAQAAESVLNMGSIPGFVMGNYLIDNLEKNRALQRRSMIAGAAGNLPEATRYSAAYPEGTTEEQLPMYTRDGYFMQGVTGPFELDRIEKNKNVAEDAWRKKELQNLIDAEATGMAQRDRIAEAIRQKHMEDNLGRLPDGTLPGPIGWGTESTLPPASFNPNKVVPLYLPEAPLYGGESIAPLLPNAPEIPGFLRQKRKLTERMRRPRPLAYQELLNLIGK